MELKTIKKNNKQIELEVIGETETLLNPITEVLLKNSDVDYASYMSDHPESNKRRLFVRVKKGTPEDALKKAVKYLENEVKNFSKHLNLKARVKSR